MVAHAGESGACGGEMDQSFFGGISSKLKGPEVVSGRQ